MPGLKTDNLRANVALLPCCVLQIVLWLIHRIGIRGRRSHILRVSVAHDIVGRQAVYRCDAAIRTFRDTPLQSCSVQFGDQDGADVNSTICLAALVT